MILAILNIVLPVCEGGFFFLYIYIYILYFFCIFFIFFYIFLYFFCIFLYFLSFYLFISIIFNKGSKKENFDFAIHTHIRTHQIRKGKQWSIIIKLIGGNMGCSQIYLCIII